MPFSVDIKYVKDTERKLGLKFPPSFVLRMVKSNGGAIATPPDAWQLYPFFDTSDRKRLKRTCNDIVRETESAREWTGFPPDAIAIGSNGGGDQLVLLVEEEGRLGDAVYWWDHETGDVIKVADDFDELSEA